MNKDGLLYVCIMSERVCRSYMWLFCVLEARCGCSKDTMFMQAGQAQIYTKFPCLRIEILPLSIRIFQDPILANWPILVKINLGKNICDYGRNHWWKIRWNDQFKWGINNIDARLMQPVSEAWQDWFSASRPNKIRTGQGIQFCSQFELSIIFQSNTKQ